MSVTRAPSTTSDPGHAQALRLEPLLRSFVDGLSGPVVLLDRNGAPIFTNKSFDLAAGSNRPELLDAEFSAEVRSLLEDTGKGNSEPAEVVLAAPALQLHGRLTPLRGTDGILLGAAASFNAVFKSPQEIEALNKRDAPSPTPSNRSSGTGTARASSPSPFGTEGEAGLLYSVLNRIQYEGIWLLDSEGKVLYVNEAACRMNGYTKDEIVGTYLFAHDTEFTPEMWKVHWVSLQTIKAQKVTTKHKMKSGAFLPVEVIASYLEHQGVGYNLALVRDISDQQVQAAALEAARDEARAASTVKSSFLANMSHELRTPFVGILGMLRLLLYTDLTEEQKELSVTALRSAESLLGILDSILDLSKIEAGKVQLEALPVDLQALSFDVAALYGTLVKEKGLQLECRVEGANGITPAVLTDAARLKQVLVNLVGNAVKFTHEGGRVGLLIKLEPSDNDHLKCKFEVQDTGIGIPEDVLPRLFQPFVQADGSTTRKFGGTGLGLAISQQLVGLLGGELTCESTVGHGSTFRFILNLTHAEKPAPAPEIHLVPADATPRTIKKVLLAEDNVVNQKVAKRLLERLGLEVDTAMDGSEAVTKALAGNYDAIYMDCMMPLCDGYQATRLIRTAEAERGDNYRIPIIAVTANAMQGDRELCLEAGMDDYVKKPFTEADLKSALARLADGSWRQRWKEDVVMDGS